jgi:fused signal recognition particle receptor
MLYVPQPMRMPTLPEAVLAQAGSEVPPRETLPAPVDPQDGAALGNWIGGGVLLALLLLVVVAWRRMKRRRGPPEAVRPVPRVEEKPALPRDTHPPKPVVQLPPNEAELARLREVEEAHQKAEALARKRRELAEAAAGAQAAEKARLEAEARALKEAEEEAKREEYRARKAVEKEERERHKREREEAERLAREAEEEARRQAEAERQRALEEEQKKVRAQAGRTLADGLGKTREQGFMARLNQLFGQSREVDEAVLGELEETLFTADIGVRTASSLVDLAREKAKKNELTSTEGMKVVIRREVERIVDLPRRSTLSGGGPPHVVMVVGVNGAGKTTTIGKLAAKLTGEGKRVVVAAGDTFRAAAAEQLDIWVGRAKAELVKGPENSDPGAVVFDAVKKARDSGADVVIADTAGRLHTKAPLMEELKKVKRVMDKALPGAPHEVLLVVDATTGQNAIAQAKQFHEAVGVSSLALTKLDGTAKGGVIIGICDELKLPVAWVGVGEAVEDLRPFEPKEFVAALFD